ncbi:MAG: pyridoxamine 5'-phosphate oxidase family protein [Methylotenera sp.]
MSSLYGKQHRAMQAQFETTSLADAVDSIIVLSELTPEHEGFIATRDMFFLTTIDHRGYPTCSYKGGNPGFVKVVDSQTLAFPSYDGNGMFLSMGNITQNNKIGMLFIDFETPHRLRLHGTATVSKEDLLLSEYQEADLIVRMKIEEVFVNCPRYIHQYSRKETSKYVPQADCETPLAQWKRIAPLQPVLDEATQAKAKENGLISPEDYGELVMKGKG